MNYHLTLIVLLLAAVSIISISSGEVVSIAPISIQAGTQGNADITLDSVPAGLSGYRMTVSSDNPAVVTVTGVSFPKWASLSEAVPGESGSFALSAIDLNSEVEKGAGSITLATLNIQASGAGSAQITMGGVQIDDDSGNPVQAEIKPGMVTIPGSTPVPTSVPTVMPTLTPTSSPQENKITLNTGWNLVNIPMELSEGSNTAEIFRDVKSAGHSILTFDSSSGWVTVGKNDRLTPMTGYWIYTTTPLSVSLSVKGVPTGSKSLATGWNLAGISGTSPRSADVALSGLSSWTYIIPYDSSAQKYRDAGIRGNTNAPVILEPYEAFWIYLNSPGTLSPSS